MKQAWVTDDQGTTNVIRVGEKSIGTLRRVAWSLSFHVQAGVGGIFQARYAVREMKEGQQ